LIASGNPVTRARHAWDTFKSGSGYAANGSGNRLTSGLGSNRYDFYRVALDEFENHPLIGIGADNFQAQYLVHGRSEETPRYPHSVEMRTLVQTGLVGVLLALLGLGAALMAGARAVRPRLGRRADPLALEVAAAALAGFGYWAVHGSFDWFWEFAGLGAPAFALLGIACALAPRSPGPIFERSTGKMQADPPSQADLPAGPPSLQAPSSRSAPRRPRWGRPLRLVVVGGIFVAAALTFAAPWLSQLQIQSAARIWPQMPLRAYARLDDAAKLNPLSDEAYVVAGDIAVRFGDLPRADHDFALALGRDPADAYATLERGAIASSEDDRQRALVLLERASRLSPRDPLTRQALVIVRAGKRVSVEELNRVILLKATQFP